MIWSNQRLNCINIIVWWPIRDLIEEIRNQGPNWKSAQIEGLIGKLMFWRPFLLNETEHFENCSLKKKREQGAANGAVLRALFAIFFPWTRKGKGRRCFVPCNAAPSLFTPLVQETRHNQCPHIPCATPQWWRKPGEPCPPTSSPAHLTLRHGRIKVALSSSAYKYQRGAP